MTSVSPGLADKVTQVRRSVLDDLRRGDLRPGDAVSITELTKRPDAVVTATPVREALRQLVGEGALAEDDARGFRVPRLLPNVVRSLYGAQEVLALGMLDLIVGLNDESRGVPPYSLDDLPPAGAPSMEAWIALLQASSHHVGLERAWRPLAMALICYRRVEPQAVPEIAAVGSRLRIRFERGYLASARHDLRRYFRACQEGAGALCELAERAPASNRRDIF